MASVIEPTPFETLAEAIVQILSGEGVPCLELGEAMLVQGAAVIAARQGREVAIQRLRGIADEFEASAPASVN